ncbi:histidine phosphatase superfamily protein [Tanacetum coccineum]
MKKTDHDRPVSKAGENDAIQVSHKLHQLGWIPQLILSSDAARTRQTLQIMQNHVRAFLEAEVHFISSFYSVAAMDGQTAHHLQRAISKYATDDILTLICPLSYNVKPRPVKFSRSSLIGKIIYIRLNGHYFSSSS